MLRRLIALIAIAMAAVPAVAQARYLHVAEARSAANTWVQARLPSMGAFVGPDVAANGGSVGGCWRGGSHTVACTYTVRWADGTEYQSQVVAHPRGRGVWVRDDAWTG